MWLTAHRPELREDSAQTEQLYQIGFQVGDVARILLKDRNDLSTTDMPDSVLAALRSAEIENVWLVGRRGPENATFSSQELRELVSIPGVDVHREGPPWVTPDPETLDRRAAGNLAAMTAAILIKNWTMSITSTPHRPEWAAKTTFKSPTKSSVCQRSRPNKIPAILQAARFTLAMMIRLKKKPR